MTNVRDCANKNTPAPDLKENTQDKSFGWHW